jgi:hypothetical protein
MIDPGPDPGRPERFGGVIVAARDRATPEQASSLAAALRHHLNAPIARGSAEDLTAQLTGPWHPIAHELHRTPAAQWNQRLTVLLRMLDTTPTDWPRERPPPVGSPTQPARPARHRTSAAGGPSSPQAR